MAFTSLARQKYLTFLTDSLRRRTLPPCASYGLMHRRKYQYYSITSGKQLGWYHQPQTPRRLQVEN